MSNIVTKILSHQNRNYCRIFVSAVTGHSASFGEDSQVTEVTIRYVGESKNTMDKVNKLMFDEGFYFQSADTDENEFTFTRAKS